MFEKRLLFAVDELGKESLVSVSRDLNLKHPEQEFQQPLVY